MNHPDADHFLTRPITRNDLTFRDLERAFREAGVPFTEETPVRFGLRTTAASTASAAASASGGPFTFLGFVLSDQWNLATLVNTFDAEGNLRRNRRVAGPLLWQMERVRDLLDDADAPYIFKTGMLRRIERHPWPVPALRAALAHAFTDRDFASPLEVAFNIHPDVIRVVVPGAADAPNLGLSDIHRRLGRMEDAAAAGALGDIFRAYEGTGRTAGVPQTGLLHEVELPSVVEALSDEESAVLRFIAEREEGRTCAEVEEASGLSRTAAGRVLKRLVDAGWVRAIAEEVGPDGVFRYVARED